MKVREQQRTRVALRVLDGDALTDDQVIAEAYRHVADGFRRALEVPGLPPAEVDALRACLRKAAYIARMPAIADLGGNPR